MHPIRTFDISNTMYFLIWVLGKVAMVLWSVVNKLNKNIREGKNIKIDNFLFILLEEYFNASVFYTGVYRGPTDVWNASHHQSKCSTNPDRLLGTGRYVPVVKLKMEDVQFPN